MRSVPDFIGIGVQKGGTTWLDHVLRRFPDIWLPPIKELHYFDHVEAGFPDSARTRVLTSQIGGGHWRSELWSRLKHGIRYRDGKGLAWSRRYFLGTRDDDWYRSLFQDAGPRTCGEITPAYSLLGSDSVGSIARRFPALKAVFMLREPVARGWSQIRMRMGRLRTERERAEFLANLDVHLATPRFLARSEYVQTIDRWHDHFGDRFHWVYCEDVQQDPAKFLRDFRRFVGLAPREMEDTAALHARVGESIRVDMPEQARLMLARHFLPVVRTMQDRFGRVPTNWSQMIEELE